jgi:hypothetical protein
MTVALTSLAARCLAPCGGTLLHLTGATWAPPLPSSSPVYRGETNRNASCFALPVMVPSGTG